MKTKRAKLLRAIALSTASLLAIGAACSAINNSTQELASNSQEIPTILPSRIADSIRIQRINRYDKLIQNCKDQECLASITPSLLKEIESLSDRDTSSRSRLSNAAQKVFERSFNSIKERCDRVKRPQESSDCYLNGIFGVSIDQIPLAAPNLRSSIDDIKQEAERLAENDQKWREEQARIQAEADERARKKREYDQRYIETTWTSNETGEMTAKAIVDKTRIRKYRSLSNNDMALAFFKIFDGAGNGIMNQDTGHKYHEIRVDCDIYRSYPSYIEFNGSRKRFTWLPKEICEAAGYPRR